MSMFRQIINSLVKPRFNHEVVSGRHVQNLKFSNVAASDQLSESKIRDILLEKFPQSSVKVEDISGGCGAMFEVHISAKEFKNLSMVKQHQMVNAALKAEVQQMHGIRIFTESN